MFSLLRNVAVFGLVAFCLWCCWVWFILWFRW